MFTRERLTRWTNALRANPEQQYTGTLANPEMTKFCCLGKLCQLEEIPYRIEPIEKCPTFIFESEADDMEDVGVLQGRLAEALGSRTGDFESLSMPILEYGGRSFEQATSANDDSVPWPVIADHFDKYYPCSDEQSAEQPA